MKNNAIPKHICTRQIYVYTKNIEHNAIEPKVPFLILSKATCSPPQTVVMVNKTVIACLLDIVLSLSLHLEFPTLQLLQSESNSTK